MAGLRPRDLSGPPPSKRQRTAAMYNRRRAVTACEPCRRRKTRCDNVRPVCGFCSANQGRCTYPDNAGGNDYATFDPASLAILDRINHVAALLEARPLPNLTSQTAQADLSSSETPESHAHLYVAPERQWENTDIQDLEPAGIPAMIDDDLFGRTDAPGHPAVLINCESILKWPIFSASVPRVHSFVLDSAAVGESRVDSTSASFGLHRGIQEDDFNNLSRKFLKLVHVKNPVLDVIEYKRFVKEAVEQGPRWDGPSCLVLITCALGCLSEPFIPARGSNQSSPQEPLNLSNYTAVSTADMGTAQCYYGAAQKRLGLLSPSHLYVQCLFLFGVFEMYCLHPLQAWNYFNQACVQFRNLLWCRTQEQSEMSTRDDSASDKPVPKRLRLLEQRLYWSCLKSELEMRYEIPLPQSGLANLKHPDIFPSPPTRLCSPMGSMGELEDVLADETNLDEQRSWFYYLAEISSRRMMNRAIMVMTSRDKEPNEGWINDILANFRHVNDMNDQIDIWRSHVPPPIDQEVSDHELAHFINIRSVSCREWIHRPFLYYAIHQSRDDPYMEQALPLAERCLQCCVSLIFQSPKHRQHGTWYVCRLSFSRALLLVAAVRSGRFSLPHGWEEAMQIARDILHSYKGEAADLQEASNLLEMLISTTCNYEGAGF
ncbi:hypothetical protein K491DRAFT_592537 [Lophiostoma macrostomum CBS 122681]|uniref:Zn(2)-C6 fungal-type domain-containing protein n=1 Tax=Lophiostoma macrostomum CBS 122681 TaxID=1314788 RepID=A0A6A6THA0_9PLEO|nr:hypothetical protein K491DRAFT_592537 [Lophiostoma macrostomum CBS 122681]